VTPRTGIVIGMMLWAGQAAAGQDSVVSRPPDRIERVRQWIEAVDQHKLGEVDDPLMRVASWDRVTLYRVWIDTTSIVGLVRDPEVLVFSAPIENEPFSGVFRQQSRVVYRTIPYSRAEVRELQKIAKEVAGHGGDDRLLKRGATLHADIRMIGEAALPAVDPARQPRSGSVMLFLSDGQQIGVENAGVHWEMGRRLLDRVKPKTSQKLGPDPGADETVRLWYLAASVYMQSTTQMDAWHVARSVQLFPNDPETLFFAGTAREWFSGPQLQNTLQSTTLSRDLFNLIGSESEELRRAERLFHDALERDPMRTEARIRLGRILGRRGRHQDAIVELRRAAMEAKEPLLLYYANMFLGSEADALGLSDEARRAYEQASELFPDAQSPRLAISTLAVRAGDRAEAIATITPVLTGNGGLFNDDPWWNYYTSQARGLEGVVTALYVSVQRGDAR